MLRSVLVSLRPACDRQYPCKDNTSGSCDLPRTALEEHEPGTTDIGRQRGGYGTQSHTQLDARFRPNPSKWPAREKGHRDEQCRSSPNLSRVLATWKDSVETGDRKSTRLNSSHQIISYALFCFEKKKSTR